MECHVRALFTFLRCFLCFFGGLPADQFEQILQQRDAQLANLLEDDVRTECLANV